MFGKRVTDGEPGTHYRSDRISAVNGQYFFSTREGTLEVNTTGLLSQLALKPTGLDALIGSSSATTPTGIAGALDKYLKTWSNSVDGQIKQRKEATGKLQLDLADRQVRLDDQYESARKRYLALVRGWAPLATEVDHALKPDDAPADAPVQDAHTRFRCLARLVLDEASDPRFATTRASLVEALPTTGRRHQIRRHLKHLAHPIIGDATHGKGPLNRWWAQRLGQQRLWLHAWQLALPHPLTGELLAFDSGLNWTVPADATAITTAAVNAAENARPPQGPAADWQWLLARLPWQV